MNEEQHIMSDPITIENAGYRLTLRLDRGDVRARLADLASDCLLTDAAYQYQAVAAVLLNWVGGSRFDPG
jgi:hypothetical protein